MKRLLREVCSAAVLTRTLLPLVLGCSLVACVSTRVEYLGTERFSPRPEDWPIVLYDAEVDIKRPFVKVAHLVGSTGGFYSVSWESLVEDMRQQAREVGADALILGGEAEYGIPTLFNTPRVKDAVAIRFTDQPRR